jgi:two-component system KDP operon response regulator KdpE
VNNKYKILIIEDEENIKKFVAALFEANNYQVLSAKSVDNGISVFKSHLPDLVILDLGLPDKDGMSFLTEIRKNSFTPVIVLSARSDESDKVDALNLGANDYVTKPFGSAELVARVKTALRTSTHRAEDGMLPGGKFETGNLVIDYDARNVFISNEKIKLSNEL